METTDEEMEQHRQKNISSSKEDVEQFLSFLEKNNPKVTEQEKEWYVFVVKNGAPCPF
ncbi:MAG: hypothetical protein PHY72_02110 [Candidatus Pacebacteria bacterium]|nr:hypothetical protein [Candidatus Paceibacterota bacterium]